MKNKEISKKWVWVSVLTVGFCLSACGNRRQTATTVPGAASSGNASSANTSPTGQSSPTPRDARALSLALVFGDGLEKGVPGLGKTVENLSADSVDPILIDGNRISFGKRLSTPDLNKGEGPLYLAWSDVFGDTRIVDATYEYRRLDSNNRAIGAPDRHPVSLDQDNGRWFISLSQIFGPDSSGINPLDQQRITLDLLLADETRVSIEVTFNLDGQFPNNVFVGESGSDENMPALGTYPGPFIFKIGQEGYEYATDQLVNPTWRPITVWARASSAPVDVRVYVDHAHLGFVSGPMVGIISTDKYVTQFPLQASVLRLTHSSSGGGSRVESASGIPGQWIPLKLAPGEQLRVEWFAMPVGGLPTCALPPTDYVNLNNIQYPNTWTTAGLEIQGSVVRDLWLTEDGSSPGQDGSGGISKLVDQHSSSISFSFGTIESGTNSFSCQGVFR